MMIRFGAIVRSSHEIYAPNLTLKIILYGKWVEMEMADRVYMEILR